MIIQLCKCILFSKLWFYLQRSKVVFINFGLYAINTFSWFEFSLFQALYTVICSVKDDLVSHFLNNLCWTNHSGYSFIVLLVETEMCLLSNCTVLAAPFRQAFSMGFLAELFLIFMLLFSFHTMPLNASVCIQGVVKFGSKKSH